MYTYDYIVGRLNIIILRHILIMMHVKIVCYVKLARKNDDGSRDNIRITLFDNIAAFDYRCRNEILSGPALCDPESISRYKR